MSFSRFDPRLVWLFFVAPIAIFSLATLIAPMREVTWTAPMAAFVITLILTALCAIGALVVMVVGWRRELAEVAVLGSSLLAASVLPMAHGLTIPGVLYGENTTVVFALFIAVPVALVIAAPLVAPGVALSRGIARHWRIWSGGWVLIVAGLVCLLLVAPRAFPAPSAGQPLAIALVLVSVGGALALSLRQLDFYRIGGRPASLVASVGIMSLGLSTIAWLGAEPFTASWWLAHLADGIGVLAAVGGLALAHWRDRTLADTFGPLLARDPFAALEVGLTPAVHGFIAALDRKDPITRDHAVRVGEMAMRLGVRAGLPPDRLRILGIGAILHDIGKMDTPEEILSKPGKLTDEEFDRIKLHTVVGDRMIRMSDALADAGPIVRSHHERVDGKGYPDGLVDQEIPLEAALVAVCDAWDAMTHARVYRQGMSLERAREIIAEGAGTQWTADATLLLAAELDEDPLESMAFGRIGEERARIAVERGETYEAVLGDAVPSAARELIAG